MSARCRRSWSGRCARSSAQEGADGEPLRLTVAGRTDRGVHAWGQVASYAHEAVDPLRLNGLLGDDVAVLAAEPAPAAFDARRDAKSRTYCYRVLARGTRSPFERGHARSGGLQSSTRRRSGSARRCWWASTTSRRLRQPRPNTPDSSARCCGPMADAEGPAGVLDRGGHVRAAHEPRAGGHDARGREWAAHGRRLQAPARRWARCEAGKTAPAHGLALARVSYE